LFAGNILNSGIIEVPLGMRSEKLYSKIGGGCPNGKDLKAAQLGGPSGDA
jgi:NADH:ubiquinone oxidoreductase subunit F (NADH-binding)